MFQLISHNMLDWGEYIRYVMTLSLCSSRWQFSISDLKAQELFFPEFSEEANI